jgi:hypothetical protein
VQHFEYRSTNDEDIVMRRFFERLTTLADPIYGKQLINMQKKQLLMRSDGRSTDRFIKDQGLLARQPIEALERLRLSQIEQYQDYNMDPFGYGACPTIDSLREFEQGNRSQTKPRSMYIMFGNAVNLMEFKIEMGLEPSPRDYEKERIVLETIPIDHFLAAIPPEFKDKFWNSLQIPNVLSQLQPHLELPAQLKLDDLSSERNILRWLLLNNSEKLFKHLCDDLFKHHSEDALKMRLNDDTYLISAICSLRDKNDLAPWPNT